MDFDARRSLMEVPAGLPRVDWPTTPLLYGLRHDLLTPPWVANDPDLRLHVIFEALDALVSRGIDGSSVVRHGLAGRLRRAVTAGVAGYEAVRYEGLVNEWTELPFTTELPGIWAQLLNRSTPRSSERRAEVTSASGLAAGARLGDVPAIDDDLAVDATMTGVSMQDYVRTESISRAVFVLRRFQGELGTQLLNNWISQAPIADLVAWSGDFRLVDADPLQVPPSIVQSYEWLVDRMTCTYVAQWATSSLHLEWQWSNDAGNPPCPPQLMLARSLPRAGLAEEIARRATESTDVSREPSLVSQQQLVDQALTLIERGQAQAAASLFDALRIEEPENAGAHNNFGFCVLPFEPAAALESLTRARTLGYASNAINSVNRMQCLLMMHQERAVLRLADELVQGIADIVPSHVAYHWSFSENRGPQVMHVSDSLPLAMLLAARAADALGQDAETWRKRHEQLCAALCVECECERAVPC